MEDGIENCHEWSLQTANQVLLLFGPIENPRWPPVPAVGSHLGFSISQKSNNPWLASCNDHSWQLTIPSSM
jgi:hypothetical protein